MQVSEPGPAVAAATAVAGSLGLAVDDAVVPHDSTKVTLRLRPSDVLTRVAPPAPRIARFELAHAPAGVAEHYPGLDHELLRECRVLMPAMIIMSRYEPGDRLPDGRRLAAEWLDQLRAALDCVGLDPLGRG